MERDLRKYILTEAIARRLEITHSRDRFWVGLDKIFKVVFSKNLFL